MNDGRRVVVRRPQPGTGQINPETLAAVSRLIDAKVQEVSAQYEARIAALQTRVDRLDQAIQGIRAAAVRESAMGGSTHETLEHFLLDLVSIGVEPPMPPPTTSLDSARGEDFTATLSRTLSQARQQGDLLWRHRQEVAREQAGWLSATLTSDADDMLDSASAETDDPIEQARARRRV